MAKKFALGQPVFIKGDYAHPYRVTDQIYDGQVKEWDCRLEDRAGNIYWEYEKFLTKMVIGSKSAKKLLIRSFA